VIRAAVRPLRIVATTGEAGLSRSAKQELSAARLALALLWTVTAFIGSAWVGWLSGVGLHGMASLCASVSVAAGLLRLGGLSWPAVVKALLIVVGLAGVLSLLGQQLLDLSDDGPQYHQQAAMVMSQGWNPLRDWVSPVTNHDAPWINGYAKSQWVYTALLMDLGAGVEAGKSLGLLLALCAGLLSYAALRERLGWGLRSSWLVALVATLNPVVVCQWTTSLNDQALASLILMALATLVLAAGPAEPAIRWRNALLLAAAFALLASIKASGVAYAGLLLVLAVPPLLWACGWALTVKMLAPGVAGFAAGVLLLGFNPYVTNTIQHGHPFHPLAGAAKVDIITANSPPGVTEQPRWVKLFGSLAARSSSVIGPSRGGSSLLTPKLPGSVNAAELKPFMTKSGVHLGGFGPWFSLALVLALAAAGWAVLRRRRSGWYTASIWLPPLLLLLSALAFPEPWWARYVPQLWLLPLVVAIALITLGRREQDRALRRVGAGLVVVPAFNAGVIALLFAIGNMPRQLDMRTQLESLRDLSATAPLKMDVGLAPALGMRLDAAGVRWKAAADCVAPAAWVPVEYTVIRACLDDSQRASFRVSSAWVQGLKARL
jgi:hypothetical protein